MYRIELSWLDQDLFLVISHEPTHLPTHALIHLLISLGVSTNYKSSKRIEISQFSQGLFDFEWFDLTPPINPPNHPYTHPWGSLHRCWIFKENWNILIRFRFIRFLVIWPDPTHQPTQPPIHPPMGGGASTDVESSNRIEISRLGQGLFDF